MKEGFVVREETKLVRTTFERAGSSTICPLVKKVTLPGRTRCVNYSVTILLERVFWPGYYLPYGDLHLSDRPLCPYTKVASTLSDLEEVTKTPTVVTGHITQTLFMQWSSLTDLSYQDHQSVAI